jgi:hypothetical protein
MTSKRSRTSSPGRSSGAYSYVWQRVASRAVERPVSGNVAKQVDGRDEHRSGPVTDRNMVERRTARSDAVTRSLAARHLTRSDAVTVPLDGATTARQRQHSRTDPACTAPRQDTFAEPAEEGVDEEAIHEESFAGLLDE